MITYTYKIDTYDGKGIREIKTKPFQGNSDVSKLNEELDSGFLTLLLKNKEPLPVMSFLQYEIFDERERLIKSFFIGNDDVKIVGKYKKYYIHNIELIEITKALEKKIQGTLCFTQSVKEDVTIYYLSDCIDRIIRVAEIVNDENGAGNYYSYRDTVNYRIPSIPSDCFIKQIRKELYDYLKEIPAPQYVFNTPTQREALDGVLKYINSVSRLEKISDYTSENREAYRYKNQTKINVNITIPNKQIQIRIIPKKLISHFIIDWGNDKFQDYEYISDIETPIYLTQNLECIYKDIGEYTISLPSDFSYELIGDEENNRSCIQYTNDINDVEVLDMHFEGIETIGNYAFYNNVGKCNNIKFENGVKNIGNYAFYNIFSNNVLNREHNIIFPQTLEEIGRFAFETIFIVKLNIIFNSYNTPNFYSSTFYDSSVKSILAPQNRYNTYKNRITTINLQLAEKVIVNEEGENINPYIKIVGSTDGKRLHVRIVPLYTGVFSIDWGDGHINEYDVVENTPIILLKRTEYNDSLEEHIISFIPSLGGFYFEGINDTSYDETLDENGFITNYKSAFWSISDNVGYFDYRRGIRIKEANFVTLEKIGDYAFANQTPAYEDNFTLKLYSNNSQTFELGKYCFYNLMQINNFELPYGISTIPEGAFCGTYPEDFRIPYSVRLIDENAFYESMYKEVYIPYGVVQIKENAFNMSYNVNTRKVYIPYSVLYIEENAINGYIIVDGLATTGSWNQNWYTNNSIVYIANFSKSEIKELSYTSFAKTKDIIKNKNIYTYNSNQNIENYATNSISFAKNVVGEEKYNNINYVSYPTSYDSSVSYWNNTTKFAKVLSRVQDYSVNDNNYGITTQFPIYNVVNLKIPIRFSSSASAPVNIVDVIGLPSDKILLDFSDLIVEEEIYNGLSEFERKAYFPFVKGDNFIYFGNSFKYVFFEYPAIRFALEKKLAEYLSKYDYSHLSPALTVKGAFYLVNNKGEDISGILDFDYIINQQKVFIEDFFYPDEMATIGYKIKYIPINSSIISSSKNNTEDCFLNTTSNINQENRVISFSNFSNTLFSLTQRNGNKQKELTCTHYLISDLINVGDFTEDGYVCTTAEYIYYNNYIVGKYALDKDYNRISSFMGVNAEIRQYEIPTGGDTYDRNCYVESFVEIDYINKYTSKNKKYYSPLFGKYLQETLGCKSDNDVLSKINNVVITINKDYNDNSLIIDYYSGKQPYFLLECIGRGGKDLLSFSFEFSNNYSAGMYSYYDTTDSKLLKKKLPYCIPVGNFTGHLRNLRFDLTKNMLTLENDTLPLFFNYGITTFDTAFSSNDLLILKDPAERLKFSYQLNFITQNNRITLGNAFSENNSAINTVIENTNSQKIRLYKSTYKYTKYDTKQLAGKKSENVLIDEWDKLSSQNNYLSSEFLNENVSDFKIQFNRETLENVITDDIQSIVLADGYDNVIMHIAYNPNDVDDYGVNYLYKPIYFNFKDRRSDIKYDY